MDIAPWYQVVKEDRDAAATTVYTALWAIDCLKTLFSPFLPFSSQSVYEFLGYDDQLFGKTTIETFHEERQAHDALVYDATEAIGTWAPSQLPIGQPLKRPYPLFKKLDESVADVEKEKLGTEPALL